VVRAVATNRNNGRIKKRPNMAMMTIATAACSSAVAKFANNDC
jgi:hypothetical protein